MIGRLEMRISLEYAGHDVFAGEGVRPHEHERA